MWETWTTSVASCRALRVRPGVRLGSDSGSSLSVVSRVVSVGGVGGVGRRRRGEPHEHVECECVGGFATTTCAIGFEELLLVGLERRHDLGRAVERASDVDVAGPVGEAPVPHRSQRVDPLVVLHLVGVRGGGHAVALGTQALDAGVASGLEQRRLGGRVGLRGRAHVLRLGGGEAPVSDRAHGLRQGDHPSSGAHTGAGGADGRPGDRGHPCLDVPKGTVADPRAGLIQSADGQGLAGRGELLELDESFDDPTSVRPGQRLGFELLHERTRTVEQVLQIVEHARTSPDRDTDW